MSAHAYNEDQLIEQPAIGLFADLGWQTVAAWEEPFGPGGTLGRETKGEFVLLEATPESRRAPVVPGAQRRPRSRNPFAAQYKQSFGRINIEAQ